MALYGKPIAELRSDLSYGITLCDLLPETGKRAPLNPSQASRYSIYIPRMKERLSWPCCRLYTVTVYMSADSHPS